MHFPKDLHCHWCLVGYVGVQINPFDLNQQTRASITFCDKTKIGKDWMVVHRRLEVDSHVVTVMNTNNRTLALASISVLLLKYFLANSMY